jgi:hypothetical protein
MKIMKMKEYTFYLLWLPKYFDEYYNIAKSEDENLFLKELTSFLENNFLIEQCRLEIYDKRIPSDFQNSNPLIHLYSAKNTIGYWGRIEFKFKNSERTGELVFNEFGFYYFEFKNSDNEDLAKSKAIDKELIRELFAKENNYPLLSETQEDVLKETFLNDHLNHKAFNQKQTKEKEVRLEHFILEACYEANDSDVDLASLNIQSKIVKLQEYKYEVKQDEYYNFKTLNQKSTEAHISDIFKKSNSSDNLDENTHKKIVLDCYEEQAISKFLNTVVSAKYFDRITKSIKEVREGLTGKIIFMTPQDTSVIDDKCKNNQVFQKWSEEKIENYVQLLISKKPLFMKIDNALCSAYYIAIGNVSSLGQINEKEDITQLLYYNEWKSLLAYFLETTKSLNDILKLYHSNRTYSELEEIKHYESNNHDKEDIDSLIKSNENKLGISEDSKFFIMILAILATVLFALPDAISSVGTFQDFFNDNPKSGNIFNLGWSEKESWSKAFCASLLFYGGLFLFLLLLFARKVWMSIKYLGNKFYYWVMSFIYKSSSTAPDDFDILEHRSNMPIKTFSYKENHFKKVILNYQEHISTHRFVRYIEGLTIVPSEYLEKSDFNRHYSILPEIVSLEGLREKNRRLYNHLKKHRTTKFSVNRVDKAKIKVTMRYRINRIKIKDFLDYYANLDSYVEFYKEYCTANSFDEVHNINQRCQKINSPEVIKSLKKDFRGIDAEFSFVGIYSFSLISKTLDHKHDKQFVLYKNSFRVYFHVDKYPIDYYNKEFEIRNTSKDSKVDLKPYDAISEMVYLVFLGRLKGFNREMGKEKDGNR